MMTVKEICSKPWKAVMTKKTKRRDATPTDYMYRFDGTKLELAKVDSRTGVVTGGNTFKVGDTAEYDSYNLSYLAKIEKITDNSVFIHGKRMDIYSFAWRNWNLDLDKTIEENHKASWYI